MVFPRYFPTVKITVPNNLVIMLVNNSLEVAAKNQIHELTSSNPRMSNTSLNSGLDVDFNLPNKNMSL